MRFAVLAFLLLLTVPAQAWEGTVTRVTDGDSIVVQRKDTGEKVKIRLAGIDCPESGQSYGKQATALVIKAALKKRVGVVEMGQDKYKRSLGAVVKLDSGMSLQELLLKAGMAWVYTRYCADCRQWRALEDEARKTRRGLWRDDHPLPPWEWRKRSK